MKRSVYEISGIRGVDLTSHPASIPSTRASYMKNLIADGNVLKKRHGFTQIHEILDIHDKRVRINGLHTYVRSDGSTELIVHAGDRFFYEDGRIVESDVTFIDSRTQSFIVGDKMFIVGCGGILVYDGEKISSPVAYVPTVIRGYDSRYNMTSEHESPNMLTRERIEEFNGKGYDENPIGIFSISEEPDMSRGIEVSIEISPIHNELRVQTGEGPDPDVDFIIHEPITAVFKITSEKLASSGFIRSEPILYGTKEVYIFNEDAMPVTVFPMLEYKLNGKHISFNFNTSPQLNGEYNISARYFARKGTSFFIDYCTFGALCEDTRGGCHLVLSGNRAMPNMCCYSDVLSSQGVAYFPESGKFQVGDAAPITAIFNLSSSFFGIFKREKFYRYSMICQPNASLSSDRSYVVGSEAQDRQGCLSPYLCTVAAGDYIVMDEDGIWGITDDSSNERAYLSRRSCNIDGALKKYSYKERRDAFSIEHEGKYYLFIGGRIFIADTEHRYRADSLFSTYEYEWWMWEGISARCACVYGDKLYLGTDKGEIFTQNDGYRDIRIIKIAKPGDMLYPNDNGCFSISEDIDMSEGAYIMPCGIRSFLNTGSFTASLRSNDGVSHISVHAPDHFMHVSEGRRIRIFGKRILGEDYFLKEGYMSFLYDDEELGLFSITDETGAPITNMAPENILEIHLYEDGGTEFPLVRGEGGYLTVLDGEQIKWENITLPLVIYNAKNVEAEYISPILCLNEPLKLKTLLRIMVTSASESNGEINFSFDAGRDSGMRLRAVCGLDLAALDFNSISFTLPCVRVYSRRVYERSFSRIIFKLSSASDADCAISSINAIYTVNDYIKGVK